MRLCMHVPCCVVGWPSFRDNEVVWDNVRCLANGETVSVDGTHVSFSA